VLTAVEGIIGSSELRHEIAGHTKAFGGGSGVVFPRPDQPLVSRVAWCGWWGSVEGIGGLGRACAPL